MPPAPSDLVLRPLEPTDAPALHPLLTHPEVAADVVAFDPSQPLPMFRSFLEKVIPTAGLWVGAERGGALVGAGQLEVSPMARRRHVGQARLGVLPVARRQGVGRAILSALLDAASSWYHLDRLELELPLAAVPARALARQLGFTEEVHKRRAVIRQGQEADVLLTSWLRPGLAPASQPIPLPARPGAPVSVKLRTAQPEDAAGLAALQGTLSVRRGTLQLPFTQARFWRHRLETNDPQHHHLRVAEHEGRLVGISGLHGGGSLRSPHAWSLGISVHPDVQGRGVGTALLRDVLSIADDWLGATRVELEVHVDNERAIHLYKAHGFEVEGTKRADTWREDGYVDAIVMSRLR